MEGAALVIGASGGIGAAIAHSLQRRGSAVAATYRRESSRIAELLRSGTGPRTRAYQLNLTDAEACVTTVKAVVADFGALHTVVYAAGPPVPMVHLSKVEPGLFREQLLGDAAAFFNIVSVALPYLRTSHGSVVAVTTAATTRFPVRDGLSSAPKGAVEAVARALAVEEGRFGIRVNCVGPGMLTEGMAEGLIASGELSEQALEITRANTPLRRFGVADDIAEAVCFLASGRAGFITGQKLNVDGGYTV
ncbi:MAG TPA: SDR family oxidoreductase [Mycobacteriales bacterium]|nr:SDR family oxidoreductase [Mycobacteriales bacterium]